MNFMKETYLILCEGSSEFAYIQELSKYLDQNNFLFTFTPILIQNGHFRAVWNKYKYVKKHNPRHHSRYKNYIKIWVDKDTYIRNDNGDKEAYKNKDPEVPNFMFNSNNFEDFLAMHMPTSIVEKWQEICRKKKHFEQPLREKEYLPLYRQHIFHKYEKANIPFSITNETIQQALSNQKNVNILFKSDFLDLLNELIKQNKK